MENLQGQTYGRLTATDCLGYLEKGHTTLWQCICSCGKVVKVRANNLKNGHTKSCGCYQEDNRGRHSLRHGHTVGSKSSPTYAVWASMKGRCLNPRNLKYDYYGARGIKVCERWLDFRNFLEDVGESKKDMELDRIDNNGNYEPSNCRWVTRSKNMRNTRATLKVIYKGEETPLITISEQLNIPMHALRRRIKNWGMTIEDAINDCKNLRKVGINKKRGKKNTLYS